MKTKSHNLLSVIACAAVIAVITAAIVWLSANPPSGGMAYYGGDYHAIDEYPPAISEAPGEPTNTPSNIDETGQHEPGNADTGALGDDEEYPAPGSYNEEYPPPGSYNNEEYPPSSTDSEDYPHTGVEEADNMPIFTSEPLPDHIIRQITGVTFHETTPFGYDHLAYLTVTHVNFDGESVLGHLIVAAAIAYETLDIFREIYEGGFPIHSIKLIDYFGASDYLSMAANNSHAFNFRYIAGTNVVSRHGFGMAIDINPVQNPYIRGETIWPAAGAAYLDRTYVRPGMVVPGDVVYNAFVSRGWTWGGHWSLPRDYHHFERR